MKKLQKGDLLAPESVQDIQGKKIHWPDKKGYIHIQFRRFAGCPMCNLHIQSVIKNYDRIKKTGIEEIVFFHSSSKDLLQYFKDSPFSVIADPEKKYYRKYGVEKSIWSILHPAAAFNMLKGLMADGLHLPGKGESMIGLPADILINEAGRVIAVKYGTHGYDQWPVDELLNIVRRQDM